MARRKLSHIEHLVQGNIVYFVRLEGRFTPDQFRLALSRVQRKHPALRLLIREAPDGLYYEADTAPEIPLRILPRTTGNDYQHECQAELRTALPYDQPQLRAVLLQSERESDLLLTTSHRICDGMSMLTIVREVLRSLHTGEELVPYEAITRRDIIGDYHPAQSWKRNLAASVFNAVIRLIPTSRRPPENNEHFLEWSASGALLDALKQRCKAEGVSIHAALLVALDRAMLNVYGIKKLPKWIENPVDIRRGRFHALKDDMVFFSGGNFQVRTGQASDLEFWARARAINQEMLTRVERELDSIPSRYHFSELLRPLTNAQVQWIVRLGDALRMNGSWNRFAFSNLGNVAVTDSDVPFRVKDLRLYMHSLNFRVLCLVTYTFNSEMRFYLVGDEKCLTPGQASKLQIEFMAILQKQVLQTEKCASEGFHPQRCSGVAAGD